MYTIIRGHNSRKFCQLSSSTKHLFACPRNAGHEPSPLYCVSRPRKNDTTRTHTHTQTNNAGRRTRTFTDRPIAVDWVSRYASMSSIQLRPPRILPIMYRTRSAVSLLSRPTRYIRTHENAREWMREIFRVKITFNRNYKDNRYTWIMRYW